MKKTKLVLNDYYQAAKDSFRRVWRNKAIWFWGLFVCSGISFNFQQRNQRGMHGFDKHMMSDFFTSNWHYIVFWVLIVLVFFLVLWVISAIARVGVIKELDKKQNNKNYKLAFKKVWEVGRENFEKILLLDLTVFWVVAGVLLVDVLLGGLVLLTGQPVFIILVFTVLVLANILIFVLLATLKPFVLIKMVLANVTIKNGFVQSWEMIKCDWKEFFKLILTLIVVIAAVGITFLSLAIIVGLVMSSFIAFNRSVGGGILAALPIILVGTVAIFFFLAIKAVGNLWRMDLLVWWVKIMKGEKAKKTKKVVKKKKVARSKTAVVGNV